MTWSDWHHYDRNCTPIWGLIIVNNTKNQRTWDFLPLITINQSIKKDSSSVIQTESYFETKQHMLLQKCYIDVSFFIWIIRIRALEHLKFKTKARVVILYSFSLYGKCKWIKCLIWITRYIDLDTLVFIWKCKASNGIRKAIKGFKKC